MTVFSSKILEETSVNTRPEQPEKTRTNTCLVLQYHRIALLAHDPLQLAVEPCKFERQMEYLTGNFNVISTDQMKQHLEGAVPFEKRTVVVTFDDGYTDVLYTAKQVLDRYKIFATAFIPSANLVTPRQLWWDRLEELLVASCPRNQLELEIDRRLYNWPLTTRRDRFRAYDNLHSILSNKTLSQQQTALDQITGGLDLQTQELDAHRTMTAQELTELEEGGLVTIGGHTHSHVKLSLLPKWQQIEEISKNKDVLEEVLGHSIEYFSYPFGSANSHTTETINILQNLGFSLACDNSYGAVKIAQETNCYELPRVKVGNWNPFSFYRFLESFFS